MAPKYTGPWVGDRCGKLIVIELLPGVNGRKKARCICDCGNATLVHTISLLRGHTTSCGCKQRKSAEPKALYAIWHQMRNRCLNESSKDYHYYGGKGIGICESWLVWEPFRDWSLANGWLKGLSIDRLDSSGDYEPPNCELVTPAENSRRRWAKIKA